MNSFILSSLCQSLFSVLILYLVTICNASILNGTLNKEIYDSFQRFPTDKSCLTDTTCGSLYSRDYLKDVYYTGLRKRLQKTETLECKQRVENAYMKQFRSLAEESPFIFETIYFNSQCPNVTEAPETTIQTHDIKHLGIVDKTLNKAIHRTDVVDPSDLSIAYVMLVHDNEDFVIRIINALDEPMHSFIIHVDSGSNDMHAYLRRTLKHRKNIYILNEGRERISWGGFSIVNATLNCMKYAYFDLKLDFDYMVDISGTHYPIKSNYYIRQQFAADLNAIYIETYPIVSRPEFNLWQQFIECDGALHRIGRIPILKGINMFVGSQWWALPKHVITWLLTSSLAIDYILYAQYIIIADENYFATMLYNSPYCTIEPIKSLNFLLFDKWEHEREYSERPMDNRKCLAINPKQCGRSPSTLTNEFTNLIESSRSLYARKFNPKNSSSIALVDYIDIMRGTHSNEYTLEMERWDHNKGEQPEIVTMIRVGNEHLIPTSTDDNIDTIDNQTITNTNKSSSITNNSNTTTTTATTTTSTKIKSSNSDITNKNIYDQNTLQTHRCITFPDHIGDNSHINFQKCNASNANQWIGIGRCTSGYELVIEDDKCPTFRRISSKNTKKDQLIEPTNEIFCSLMKSSSIPSDYMNSSNYNTNITTTSNYNNNDKSTVSDKNSEVCFDVTGETPKADVGLIAYKCSGRWNQIFKLGDNCTIMAVQPGFIGRVRGYGEESLSFCLSSDNKYNQLTTAYCSHTKQQPTQQQQEETIITSNTTRINDNTTIITNNYRIVTDNNMIIEIDNDGNNKIIKHENNNVNSNKYSIYTYQQQFEFMPNFGNSFKRYLHGSISIDHKELK